MRLAILALVVGLVTPAAGDEVGATKTAARGTFRSGGISFEMGDAYAFRAKASLGDETVIVVAVTNATYPREVIDEWWDRRQALQQKFASDETALVFFEFTPQGEYLGVSYYFRSGNGCGYCSGGVDSTVKLTGSKLVGSLKATGKDRTYDIALDVPVASDDHGAALPDGGGEPAQIYYAYHDALNAGQAPGVKKTLDSYMLKQMAQAEQDNEMEAFLDWLGGQRYLDTVKVEKGFANAKTAVLLVSGSGPIGKRQGQVVLTREKDGWRFSDEVIASASE